MVLKHMLHLRDIWKEAKLQDTQTGRVSYPTVLKPDKVLSERQVWKSVRLQGSQIFCEWRNGVHAIWKGIELQGAQIPLRDESSQPSFESGSNYRVLKLDVWCAGLANWFEGNRITEFSNACYTLLHGVLRVWKKINYKDLKLTSVFAPEQLWFGKR